MSLALDVARMRIRYGIPPGLYDKGIEAVERVKRVLVTNPTVPVLLELAKWKGRQILFRDAACTIPVRHLFDPIGGVCHPLTGEIVAVQPSDAARAIWGGPGVGAVFDGVTSYLEAALGSSWSKPITGISSQQILSNGSVWSVRPAGHRLQNNSETSMRLRGPVGFLASASLRTDEFDVYTGIFDEAPDARLRKNGGQWFTGDNYTDTTAFDTLYLGVNTPAASEIITMHMRAMTLWDGIPNVTTIAAAEEALA